LGPETLIYVQTDAGEIIAKADGRSPPAVGDTVVLSAQLDNLHVFDAKTGMVLV
jgi:multiple sugar transport system ATP-binding protein